MSPELRYQALIAKVDEFASRAHEQQAPWLNCQAGCAGCCLVERGALAIEIDALRSFLEVQPPGLLEALKRRLKARQATEQARCIFLNDDNLCDVYAARPLICRSHGPAVRTPDGDLAWCELNFSEMSLADINAQVDQESVMNLDLVNHMLVLINQTYLDLYPQAPHQPLAAALFE